MAVVQRNSDLLRNPPSPSLTNPDMILPYDPRLRDSTSTQQSGGPDINSLNDQMAMSLNTTRAINRGEWEPAAGGDKTKQRRSIPGEWNEHENSEVVSPAHPDQPDTSQPASSRTQQAAARGGSSAITPGTSFLNLNRFSTISAQSATKSDGSNGVAHAEQEDEEEVAARNDFARAEEILANAKKRLTTMESNLTRARSISISRSASVASNVPEDASFSARLHNGIPRPNGWAVSAAKLRGTNWTPSGQGTGHSRVFSENALPNSKLSLIEKVTDGDRPPVRSSSAMGSFQGEDRDPTHDYHSGYRGGFSRLEPLREDELLSPSSDSSRNNSRGLDRLQDLSAKARSNVQLRDLREQMQDLKGKLDTLKQRTREDGMRRRSMQYLKSPSPFTDAEAWRNTPPRDGSRQSSAQQSEETTRPDESTPQPGQGSETSRSLPNSTQTVRVASPVHDQEPLSSPGSMAGGPRGVIEGALNNLDEKLAGGGHVSPVQSAISHRPNLSGTLPLPPTIVEKSAFDPWSPQSEKAEILNADVEDEKELAKAAGAGSDASGEIRQEQLEPESGGNLTSAEEAKKSASETSNPAEVSHEDRPDAFDYENFIISSTMGTYSRETERSRSSSASTSTIGPDAYLDSDEPSPAPSTDQVQNAVASPSYHTRHPSAGSTSSLDTFATAQSRAASRLQAGSRQTGSRQALREAASREMIGSMPGAFVYSHNPTPVPSAPTPTLDEEEEETAAREEEEGEEQSTPQVRPRDRASTVTSNATERPLSMASLSSFSRLRPPSTLYHGSNPTYSIASTTASIFSATTAAPAIDPASDPAAIAARGQILRALLASPLNPGEAARVAESDERLVLKVVEGLQRACGALVWSNAVHGFGGGRMALGDVRTRLERAGYELGTEEHRGSYGEGEGEELENEEEIQFGEDGQLRTPESEDATSSLDGGEERFVAL